MVAKFKKLLTLILALAILMTGTVITPTPVLAAELVVEPFQLAGGYNFSLAIKDGTLYAWGDNSFGQLGDGTTTSSSIPVQVMDEVMCVAAGRGHSLAIKTDGTLWAWGDNSSGQLGDGTTTDSAYPVLVGGEVNNGVGNVTRVVAGQGHSLALKDDGTLWAWGDNTFGQLGIGSTASGATITPVRVMSNVKNVAAGDYHSMAITKSEGKLWAWGANGSGQLGDGTTTNRATPIPVMIKSKVLSKVINVSAGYGHSLALKEDGTLYAWGYNGSGQLGDGTTTNKLTPVKVLSQVTSMATVCYHNLAIKKDKTLWAWGDNGFGQLGDGTFSNKLKPVKVLSQVTSVATGDYHSLAFNKDGTLYAWGSNDFRQPDDTTILPAPVEELNEIKCVASGYSHSLVVKEDGTLYAWGSNDFRQLGDGTTTAKSLPVLAKTMKAVKSVAAGLNYTLAIKDDGTLWAWGANEFGQLGVGNTKNRSTPVKVMSGVQCVAASDYHSLALKEDGTLWAWGANGKRQLGDGTTKNRLTPIQVMSEVKSIATSFDHTLALKNDGTLWAWGTNGEGQLGDGTTTNRATPVKVQKIKNLAMSGVISIAAGHGFSLAIKADGTLWAWGANWSGQLGDGTTINHVYPVQVISDGGVLSGVKSVAAGESYTLAIIEGGTLYAWGSNDFRQLGSGTTTASSTPIWIMDETKSVSAGDYDSFAIKNDGSVWAWGLNSRGQLGNGTTTTTATPVMFD